MRRPGARRCEHVTEAGAQCRAYALRASDPPRCRLHAMEPDERATQARRAASVSAVKRRKDVEPADRSGIDPGLTLGDVLAVVGPALEATFAHDGSPDWSARLAAAGVLVSAFPRQYRETPEAVQELLARIIPGRVYDPERMQAQKVYSEMRREWDKLPSWHPLRGLYVRPYPSYMVAPWEDPAVVARERPADIPPERAPVTHLPGGRVALDRGPGELPLLLEESEDDGGLTWAQTILH